MKLSNKFSFKVLYVKIKIYRIDWNLLKENKLKVGRTCRVVSTQMPWQQLTYWRVQLR